MRKPGSAAIQLRCIKMFSNQFAKRPQSVPMNAFK